MKKTITEKREIEVCDYCEEQLGNSVAVFDDKKYHVNCHMKMQHEEEFKKKYKIK